MDPWGTPPPTAPPTAPPPAVPPVPAASPVPREPLWRRALVSGLVPAIALLVWLFGGDDPSADLPPAPTTAPQHALYVHYGGAIAVQGREVFRTAVDGTVLYRIPAGDWPPPLTEAEVPGTVAITLRDGGSVVGTTLSADGRRVASIRVLTGPGRSLDLTVRETADGSMVDALAATDTVGRAATDRAHGDVVLSADGSVVAGAAVRDGDGAVGQVLVRRVGQRRATFEAQSVPGLVLGSASLSADGRWLAYGDGASDASPDGRTRVVDLAAPGTPGHDLPQVCSGAVSFAPDPVLAPAPDAGSPVVLCRLAGQDVLRLTPTGAVAGPPLGAGCASVSRIAVSPDGLAAACVAVGPVDVAAGTAGRPVLRFFSPVPGAGPVSDRDLPVTDVPGVLAWAPDGDVVVLGYPYLALGGLARP
jgi:hypothetical protein